MTTKVGRFITLLAGLTRLARHATQPGIARFEPIAEEAIVADEGCSRLACAGNAGFSAVAGIAVVAVAVNHALVAGVGRLVTEFFWQ
ncbi:hypothetical protein B7486_51965, partial [cyanobacterium TDX16]